MIVTLTILFIGINNSGLKLIIGSRTHKSQFLNPPKQRSRCQSRDKEIEKCMDEGLKPTSYSSIFNSWDFIKAKAKWMTLVE